LNAPFGRTCQMKHRQKSGSVLDWMPRRRGSHVKIAILSGRVGLTYFR
jgi:hypothetical protein